MLPEDLVGHYFRNGPNPEFTPLGSYTFPLEGDGMIHGVWLEAGQAHYANHWLRTNGLKAEERAGKALYGGIMTPAFVDMSLLGDDPDPGWPFKLDAFVNVIVGPPSWTATTWPTAPTSTAACRPSTSGTRPHSPPTPSPRSRSPGRFRTACTGTGSPRPERRPGPHHQTAGP
jgi:hypothetical protein